MTSEHTAWRADTRTITGNEKNTMLRSDSIQGSYQGTALWKEE